MDLSLIPAFDGDTFHVVVESPRGSALKLKYESAWQAMSISRPLPAGVVYPFDWGFIPSTMAADGDPLDAMVIWDVPSYPGVVLRCRAIGVIYVEQNKTNHDPSERIHNDRVLAIPAEARREATVTDVGGLSPRLRAELEHFAGAATALEGKDVRVTGWGDSAAALELVRQSAMRR
jgi:inorganic pyrophosphatase